MFSLKKSPIELVQDLVRDGWLREMGSGRVALVQMVFKYMLRARASEEAKFDPTFI